MTRNLNWRDCPLGSSLVSVEQAFDEIPATGGRRMLARYCRVMNFILPVQTIGGAALAALLKSEAEFQLKGQRLSPPMAEQMASVHYFSQQSYPEE